MSGIRGKDTRPEMQVRRMLHAAGYRYRLHDRKLPGKPDLVLRKHRVVIMVQGCFWHGHDNCRLFRLPKSRTEFWKEKISGNIARDSRNLAELGELGWRSVLIWECALKGANRLNDGKILETINAFISVTGSKVMEIRGARDDR